MDRLDAMQAFVTTADHGSFTRAAKTLGRSPAAITRAIAFLEERMHTQLFRRTTRVVKLTSVGERYLETCRRVLAELAAAEDIDTEHVAPPRGLLTITAPIAFGRLRIRPLVDQFLDANPEVQARLLLLDRVVSLIDEGVDVAIRIAHLPDSSQVATKVGEVSRIVCASPGYLAKHARPKEPADLTAHTCIGFAQAAHDTWQFKGKQIKLRPRLCVTTADAAIDSALEGHGITRVLSYQVARELKDGQLVRLLRAFEPEPLPIHVVCPANSASGTKVRAFLDYVVPKLRQSLEEYTKAR